MRQLMIDPGPSQQQLAQRLGMVPSRIVSYVDDLESRGRISRTRDTVDRRVNVITITATGRDVLKSISTIAREHEKKITDGLDEADRDRLRELLGKLATARGLTPGVHPGFRRL